MEPVWETPGFIFGLQSFRVSPIRNRIENILVPAIFRRAGPIMEVIYKLLREVKVLPPSPQILPKVLDALHHEQTTDRKSTRLNSSH